MAGEWMKIELALPDKPEVHYIANALNLDPDAVVGKLFRVWAWFDLQTENGNALGVTVSLLDRITRVTGFGEAMLLAGWIEQHDKTLHMPNFDRHTSQSSKKRALTAKRVQKLRNANVTQSALPREEKRRSKEVHAANGKPSLKTLTDLGVDEQAAIDWLEVRKAKRAPLTDTVINDLKREAEKAGIPVARAVLICAKRSWQGFNASWNWKDDAPKQDSKMPSWT